MNNLIKNIISSEIFRNVSILVSGTVIAQLIPIGLQLILRRIYPQEVFGAFSVYLSVVNIALFFYSFRYELSVVNPKDDTDAINIVALIWILSFFSASVFFIGLLFFKSQFSNLINFPEKFTFWLYFLPFTILAYAIYLSLQYWLIRKKAFKGLTFNKISRRTTEGIVQTALGFGKINFGLVLGDFLGMVSNIISGLYQSVKSGFSFRDIRWAKIKQMAKQFKEYPLYNLIPALGNTAGLMLPVIFFNKFFGAKMTGNFDLTRQVLAVPLSFLSVSISQVYLQRWAEKFNNKISIKKDFLSLLIFLGTTSLFLVIIFYFFGQWIFTFFFGKKWFLAGEFSQILIFKYALVFIVSPLSVVFIAFQKIKIASFWQIYYFFAIASLLLFKTATEKQFLQIYVIIELISYSIYFFMIALLIFKYEKNLKNETSASTQ